MSVYKEAEFQAFIGLIKKGQVQHWVQIADALGVDKNTIAAWKKRPEAKSAISKGISDSLEKMERAGKNDWRMWEAKLRMLGVSDRLKLEAEIQPNPIAEILARYGLKEDETPRKR